jgi:pimeloyl-ACP methyl ester carboxylesterase
MRPGKRISKWAMACLMLAPFSAQAAEGLPTIAVKRSSFLVGGGYSGEAGKEIMRGQMFVEYLAPAKVTRKYPLVRVHGAAQTTMNWMGTPDGRKGWAEYFMERGYAVYMIEQPARGRSAWHPNVDGALRTFTAPQIEKQFTAPAFYKAWPQSAKHTQWPGAGGEKNGRMGDPVFDAFYASQVQSLASDLETQEKMKAASAALLDRIGPAILLTHSQGGLLGWVMAEARPQLVKGIITIEPSGPPFENAVLSNTKARPWGITDIPVAYDPPAAKPEDIKTAKQDKPDGPDLVACTLQAEPARKLVALSKIPTLLVVSEASYHAPYDHCTARFLKQAGVPVTFMRLEDKGLHGNAHMVMYEKNNLEIAKLLTDWAVKTVK